MSGTCNLYSSITTSSTILTRLRIYWLIILIILLFSGLSSLNSFSYLVLRLGNIRNIFDQNGFLLKRTTSSGKIGSIRLESMSSGNIDDWPNGPGCIFYFSYLRQQLPSSSILQAFNWFTLVLIHQRNLL